VWAEQREYKLNGGDTLDIRSGNSNSIAATLENIMGYSAIKLQNTLPAPGLQKNLLPEKEYGHLYNHSWEKWNPYHLDDTDNNAISLAGNMSSAAENCIIC
jgi:hypothetical protein